MQGPIGLTLEVHAEVQEVPNSVAGFVDNRTNHRFVARPSPCRKGVLNMCFNRSLSCFVKDGGDALRPVGGRILCPPFGEDLPPFSESEGAECRQCRCRPPPPALLRARVDLPPFPFDRIGEADRAIDAVLDISAWGSYVAASARCLA